jgi:hypothetical protein
MEIIEDLVFLCWDRATRGMKVVETARRFQDPGLAGV